MKKKRNIILFFIFFWQTIFTSNRIIDFGKKKIGQKISFQTERQLLIRAISLCASSILEMFRALGDDEEFFDIEDDQELPMNQPANPHVH